MGVLYEVAFPVPTPMVQKGNRWSHQDLRSPANLSPRPLLHSADYISSLLGDGWHFAFSSRKPHVSWNICTEMGSMKQKSWNWCPLCPCCWAVTAAEMALSLCTAGEVRAVSALGSFTLCFVVSRPGGSPCSSCRAAVMPPQRTASAASNPLVLLLLMGHGISWVIPREYL